jgi:hypothetical protein
MKSLPARSRSDHIPDRHYSLWPATVTVCRVPYSVGSDKVHQGNLYFYRNDILTLSALNDSTHVLISSASCYGLIFF